jgi:hypothetical protein
MSGPDKKELTWKERLSHEMVEYLITAFYLALVFAAFTQYRRFLLAAHDITYTNYGVAVVEALILGKVILIGRAVRLGRGLEGKPLIFSTLYKTVVFSCLVAVFTLVEEVIKGLWHGKGLTGGLVEYFGKGSHELLANCLVIFVALIPFFAFRELGRVFGREKVWALFFGRADLQGSDRSGAAGA